MKVNVAILGAGCAGLALARCLKEQGFSGSVLLLESRQCYKNDRTWCYWAKPDSQWHKMAQYRWQQCLFSSLNDAQHIHYYDSTSYCCLPAENYYDFCLQQLDSSNVSLKMEVEVVSVSPTRSQSWLVETTFGNLEADIVIDTRPRSCEAILYQSFLGYEVTLSRPIFAPDTVRLMCNMHGDSQCMRFYYILPFSPWHILIEPTVFHRCPLNPKLLKNDLQSALRAENIEIESIIRRESAILPMGQTYLEGSVLVKGGIAGGALRASSGYGFLRIQAWALACAQSIITKEKAFSHQHHHLQARMDHLFLNVIKHNPVDGPDYFIRMASQLKGDQFSAFMSDEAGMKEWMQVISALPKWPFIKEVMAGG